MSLHTLFLCSLPHLLVFKSYARFFRVDATSHTHFRSLFPGEINPKGLWTQRRRVGLEEDCTELTWIEIEDKVKVHILGESTSPPLAPFLPSAPQTLANSCLTLKKKPGRFLDKDMSCREKMYRWWHLETYPQKSGICAKNILMKTPITKRPICLEPRVCTHRHAPLALQHGWMAKDHQTYEWNPPTWKTKSKS